MLRLSLLWTVCLFLAPILILQGVWVRRRALRLPEAAGPRRGGEGKLKLLVIGDSIVAGVGVKEMQAALPARLAQHLSQHYPEGVSWQAVGHNGDRLRDVIQRLPLIAESADLVVVNVGVNDVSHLTSMMRWQLDLTSLVADLTQRFRAPIVLLGLPPMDRFPLLPQPLRFALGTRARLLDHSLMRVGELVPQVTYIATDLSMDAGAMAADGYHPGFTIVDNWSAEIAKTLVRAAVLER